MNTKNEEFKTNEPLTAESLDAAFRIAAEAREEFALYLSIYHNRPTIITIVTTREEPYEKSKNEINQQMMLYRIQQKQELAIRTIHKWCKDAAIIADTEEQTLRIAREHKEWSDIYKDGGNGAWIAPGIMHTLTGEMYMPPPDETIRQACKEIQQYDEILSRYETTIRQNKKASQC